MFGYIAAVAVFAGVAVGILPALRASKTELNAVLREGGRGSSDGSSRQRVRSALVVGQVAISLVLLVAAGLFVRSAMHAATVDLGFDPSHVLNASVDVAQQGYDEARGRAFFDELLRRARQLPGVESASLAYSVPLGYYNVSAYLEIEGQPPSDKTRRPFGGYNVVGPGYQQTMRMKMVKGRFIETQDDERSRLVGVINEYMANRFWPTQDPIGRRFRSTDLSNQWIEVVGVVHDGKPTGLFSDPSPYFYVPLAQTYRSLRVLQLRTAGDPAALAAPVQREIRVLDPDLPVFDVTTMQRMLEGPNGFLLLRMGALFGGTMGFLGLALALVGIYGVVSYAASQRTQEIGVRMALGAARADILRLVLGRGLMLVGIGVVLGLIAAAAVSRLVSSLLFGISAVDPVTFVVVPLALAAMALLASYVPAYGPPASIRPRPCEASRGRGQDTRIAGNSRRAARGTWQRTNQRANPSAPPVRACLCDPGAHQRSDPCLSAANHKVCSASVPSSAANQNFCSAPSAANPRPVISSRHAWLPRKQRADAFAAGRPRGRLPPSRLHHARLAQDARLPGLLDRGSSGLSAAEPLYRVDDEHYPIQVSAGVRPPGGATGD